MEEGGRGLGTPALLSPVMQESKESLERWGDPAGVGALRPKYYGWGEQSVGLQGTFPGGVLPLPEHPPLILTPFSWCLCSLGAHTLPSTVMRGQLLGRGT